MRNPLLNNSLTDLAKQRLEIFAADCETLERVICCLAGVLLDDEGVSAALLAFLDYGWPIDAALTDCAEGELAVDKTPVLKVNLIHAALHALSPKNGIHTAAHNPAKVGLALENLAGVEHHLEDCLTTLAVLDSKLIELEVVVVVLDDDAFFGRLLGDGVKFTEKFLPFSRREFLVLCPAEPWNCSVLDAIAMNRFDRFLEVVAPCFKADMSTDWLNALIEHYLAKVGRSNLGGQARNLGIIIADFFDLGKGLGKFGSFL